MNIFFLFEHLKAGSVAKNCKSILCMFSDMSRECFIRSTDSVHPDILLKALLVLKMLVDGK